MNTAACAPAHDTLALPQGVRLRPITEADLPLLERVYASTRTEELAQTDWDDARKDEFLAFQFRAQHAHYTTHYAGAQFLVIERDGAPVGRLYLHWRTGDLRIVDIALLPGARGHGTGEALLRALLDAAVVRGHGASIHVEQMNPAMRLYQRLGFIKAGEHGIYHLMEWRANGG